MFGLDPRAELGSLWRGGVELRCESVESGAAIFVPNGSPTIECLGYDEPGKE